MIWQLEIFLFEKNKKKSLKGNVVIKYIDDASIESVENEISLLNNCRIFEFFIVTNCLIY